METSKLDRLAGRRSGSVATAESLTNANISCHVGAAENSTDWFRGGVVAHQSEAKFKPLKVERGRVVAGASAAQMADGVATMAQADLAVGVSGVGGQEPEEDQPSWTVFMAVRTPEGTRVARRLFSGGPSEMVRQTTFHALLMLEFSLAEHPGVPHHCAAPAAANTKACSGNSSWPGEES